MKLWWALPLMLLCGAESAMADGQNQVNLGWLKTIAFAAHQTNYSGTFIYQYGSHVETSRITHVLDQNGEHEKLESLDGPHREIIRNNDEVWCSLDGHKMVLLGYRHKDRSFPALLPEQFKALSGNYRIHAGHTGRVAGFKAQTILFQPRDRLRYAHKFWAQADTGLLLKAAVLNSRNQVVEQYAFTQLNIGGNIKQDWAVPNQTRSATEARDLQLTPLPKAGKIVSSGWQVDAMPSGFRKIMEIRRPMHGRKAPVLHMVYSDGLAGISVFVEDLSNDADDVNPGLSSQGAIQVYRKQVGEHLVTVVGEVPPRTVMQVADSVRYAGD